MADNKSGRDEQADDSEKRQRERDLATELKRRDEPEPPIDPDSLARLEADLGALRFPTTGSAIVAAVGDNRIESPDETHTVAELLPDTDGESFRSPSAVRQRVKRPSVAAVMKRIVETGETVRGVDPDESQRDAYERTLQELRAIDADDDDEGVAVIGDWVITQAQLNGAFPGSRSVRRQAAKFCRANGYEIRNDEWLGI
ncbi:hypothetical protein [Natronomonas sp.]|uniref:DUF5789 family protein n=1 Tax=Natronomonas sp. TaxID=2184060 RepID=UPI002636C442|nr:hypothetical protein [Natronomonas sp.]